ncbi:MAG: S8 family serine peptidase, partial [Polaribacter sp.]
MRILKPIMYTAIAGFTFTSCKLSIATIPVPVGIDNMIHVTAKKGTLTQDQMNRWSHADLQTDSIPGMSVAKAYKFLQGKKGVQVIVGIEDAGVDITQEDLKDVIWTNPKEIAGNNKDDDKNGYVDDIHGWNFLGSKDGRVVSADQLELTRIVKKGMVKFGGKKASDIAEADKTEYQQYLKLKEIFDKKLKSQTKRVEGLKKTEKRINQIENNFASVKKIVGKDTFTAQDLKSLKPTDPKVAAKIADVVGLLANGMTYDKLEGYKKRFMDYKEGQEKSKSYDLDFNSRQSMGDNLDDITDTDYGNNKVMPNIDSEIHATHVSGIVAASRNNGKGVNGVANNVRIMVARTVPDGDEHDKDVALAMRYLVDNGAKIINTSFGKGYSPHKQWVFDAIKYAEKHDVLIVNAAGNDAIDIDVKESYPTDTPDMVHPISDNMLTIGAMSLHYDKNLPASFSNYGKRNVDLFAPGVDIYSTFPNNKYQAISGTSMAAPSAAGVAAIVRSYYPQLSASQVKHILMNSGTKIDFDVIKPGTKTRENPNGKLVPFSDLSVSGRIVNAYNAVKMADAIVNGKK